MPYFLRATDEASALNERRLRHLQRTMDLEQRRARARATAASAFRDRAFSLLCEAERLEMIEPVAADTSDTGLLEVLKSLSQDAVKAKVVTERGPTRRTPRAEEDSFGRPRRDQAADGRSTDSHQ